MAFETKEFLDIEGLRAYTNKILELINQKADASIVAGEVATLKAIIGDINLLGENYKNVVNALLAEISRAQQAENQIVNSFSWGALGK